MDILEKNIDAIIKNKVILHKLYNAGINTIGELRNCTPKELTEKQIENVYIKDITIALQCNDFDLKKNNKR